LEIQRQEVEDGAEGRPEQERDRNGCGEVTVGEQPRRHERLATAPLDDGERAERDQAGCCAGQDGRRAPAEAWALPWRKDEQRDAERPAEGAGQVDAAAGLAPVVGWDQ